MLFYFNKNLFKLVKKPGIETFKKLQVRTAMTNHRVCTILYDGENINDHKLNVKASKLNGESSVVIRSNERNNFDAMVILAAIPFNGVLLAGKEENYRYRKAFVVPITDEMKVSEPSLYEYSHICYAIIEPNTNVLLQEGHAKHCDAIYINIFTKEQGHDGVSTTMCLRKGDADQVVLSISAKPWNLRDPKYTDPLYIPYDIFISPEDKAKAKATSTKKPFTRRPEGNKPPYQKRNTGYSKPGYQKQGYKKPATYTKSQTDNANYRSSSSNNTGYKTRETFYDETSDLYLDSSKKKYPAKPQKELKNKAYGKSTKSTYKK